MEYRPTPLQSASASTKNRTLFNTRASTPCVCVVAGRTAVVCFASDISEHRSSPSAPKPIYVLHAAHTFAQHAKQLSENASCMYVRCTLNMRVFAYMDGLVVSQCAYVVVQATCLSIVNWSKRNFGPLANRIPGSGVVLLRQSAIKTEWFSKRKHRAAESC